MQKARRHQINQLRPLVSTRFQVLFTSLFEILFTFPSRYQFTIGLSGVFSLTGWYRQIPTGFLLPRGTQDTVSKNRCFVYGIITLYDLTFQLVPLTTIIIITVLQPPHSLNYMGLGSFLFARRYSGNHYYFLFLCLLRCFSSAGLRLYHPLKRIGCPIRKSVTERLQTPTHSLSQSITSFFASESLGIHRVPLVTYSYQFYFTSNMSKNLTKLTFEFSV